MTRLFARGKLLISGEYLVLHGATALAVPLKKGQWLNADEAGVREGDGIRGSDSSMAGSERDRIEWTALHRDQPWLRAEFSWPGLALLETSDLEQSLRLAKVLRACTELDSGFLERLRGARVETRLEFDPAWGWGASSTLTHLLAVWAGIDPMELHFRISNGSGFDVACAGADGPLHYRLPEGRPEARSVEFRRVEFRPPFRENLFFAWLGRKQSTRTELLRAQAALRPSLQDIRRVDEITRHMTTETSLDRFRSLMEEHEDRLAALLGRESVGMRFPGLPATVKSLGAWGGDFVLIASSEPETVLRRALKDAGIETVFPYDDIVHDEHA